MHGRGRVVVGAYYYGLLTKLELEEKYIEF